MKLEGLILWTITLNLYIGGDLTPGYSITSKLVNELTTQL